MQRIQLYIEDKSTDPITYPLVDMFDNETVQLTSTIQDVKDIGKVFTDFSMPFTVPASETNNKIFRHFYNYNITGDESSTKETAFDARKKRKAKIHINYSPFREGKIFLNSVKMRNNKAYAYEIIFYGNTVSLKDLIGDDELTDLTHLSNYNHEYKNDVVKNGFTDGLDLNSQTDSIIYPLITSKKRLFYHSGSIPFADNTSGNLYHDSSTPSAIRGLEYTDLKPAIRVMHIIEAIEEKYGISFTRDFFTADLEEGTPKNPAFYNLYMWINGVKDEFDSQDDEKIQNFTFDCTGYTFDNTSDEITEITFENGIVEMTKVGTTTAYVILVETDTGDQDSLFTVRFTEVDSNGDAIVGGDVKELNSQEYVGGATTADGVEIMDSSVPAGTVKRYKIEYLSKDALIFDSTLEFAKAPNGSLITEKEAYTVTDQSMSFSIDLLSTDFNILPKIKVIDFLTGLFKMFNLTAYYIDDEDDSDYNLNNRPTIYVDTLDNFYADAVNNKLGGLVEIEKYVDASQHTVNSTLPFTDINFNYQETDVVLNKNHFQQFNEVFGDSEFNVREGTKNQTTGEYTIDRGSKYDIQIPFSHFKYERILDLNEASTSVSRNTDIAWGYCATGEFNYTAGVSPNIPPVGDYDSTTIAPLLFYAISETTDSAKKINWVTAPYSAQGEGIQTYWRPSNSNEEGDSTTPPSYTLNFDTEVDEWQGINYTEDVEDAETNSLYYVFYKSYVESVFNPLKRMFKLRAFLPPNIIINYKLNDQIKIRDKIFRINSITTNLMTGESELELLNIFSNEIVQ